MACLENTVHAERMTWFSTRRTWMEKTMHVLMVLSSTNPFCNGHIQDKGNCSGINTEHTSVHINSLHLWKKFLKHHTKTAVNDLYFVGWAPATFSKKWAYASQNLCFVIMSLRRGTLHAQTFTSCNYGEPEYAFTESCFKKVTKHFRMSLFACIKFSCTSLQSIISCNDLQSDFYDRQLYSSVTC